MHTQITCKYSIFTKSLTMQLENNLSSVTLYRLDESPTADCFSAASFSKQDTSIIQQKSRV